MAAKGSLSKEIVTQKILNTFAGSFINEKEIRIPMVENGEVIQLKVALTCAKTNVENPNDKISFGDISAAAISADLAQPSDTTNVESLQPTAEEKQRVEALATKLGIIS